MLRDRQKTVRYHHCLPNFANCKFACGQNEREYRVRHFLEVPPRLPTNRLLEKDFASRDFLSRMT